MDQRRQGDARDLQGAIDSSIGAERGEGVALRARLVDVEGKYDPGNLLRFGQSNPTRR